jgi:hypothetical protein
VSFDSLTNRGEFFSNHYLDAIIGGDLGDLRRRWDDHEAAHKDTARSRLRGLGKSFFPARAGATEASRAGRAEAVRALNALVLQALGFTVERRTLELPHTTTDELHVPVAAAVDTGSGLHLVALDADLADEVDDLFDTSADAVVQLLDLPLKVGEKRRIRCAADAVGELFAVDDPPRWVVVVAGRLVLLAERTKWAEGRFLAVDLDSALERNDTRKAGELETIAALFSTDVLVPDEGQAVIDDLVDKSHKHAVGVSKELREGIRQSIEILANEVIEQRLELSRRRHDVRYAGEQVDPRQLTTQCLRYLYRLLVLLYAESRPELGIVPVNDDVYLGGYSLDRLRELTLVELETDDARDGSHLDESLRRLFALVNDGNHEETANALFASEYHDVVESREEYLEFPGLDALLFAPKSIELLDGVILRNAALQQVLRLLMLTPEAKGKKARRGFISYAQLGINQLGAVYEGLMAYTGFFAADDLYEVAKDGDPSDGTWVVPVSKADEYPDEVFVTRTDPLTGHTQRIHHPKGSFVFRLSGRDRQRSASYYTPEVLTRCVVKHALAELLGLDDHAPENGSSGITEARQILDLTICEPALGSGAFLNEAINQLSAEYLRRRQDELGETLDPERYLRELQKVKAHFALHQSYGVDLNATAVELAEVSLWLNCMHPGLKAPWFGLQLRRGNSLVGCRRATWRTFQLKDRPWAQTSKDKLQPPVDRPLGEPVEADEIHHFLLPGHGWAAVADRAEAKEFRPKQAKLLRDWRKAIVAAPRARDAARLTALAAGVERLWTAAADRIRLTQRALRRPIDVWGTESLASRPPVSRESAMQVLDHPDSELGRLRILMDAWVGLWFWELDAQVAPPTWAEWLTLLEEIVEPVGAEAPTGQLDVFEELHALLESDERERAGSPTMADLRAEHPWLDVAVSLARREGAWHWELEFAPAFISGGFDLQIGNPPWVEWEWPASTVLADFDPRIAVTSLAEADFKRIAEANSEVVLGDLAAHVGAGSLMSAGRGSESLRPLPVNTYRQFLVTALRLAHPAGSTGLIHPDLHWSDSRAGGLRLELFGRLRRDFRFINQKKLFEDIGNTRPFSLAIYGTLSGTPNFVAVSRCVMPLTVDESLDGSVRGELPVARSESGDWVVSGHPDRVVHYSTASIEAVGKVIGADFAPSAGLNVPRLPELFSEAELALLEAHVARRKVTDPIDGGLKETASQQAGLIKKVLGAASPEVLQSAHLSIASPFFQQTKDPHRSHRDYEPLDLEVLEGVPPRRTLFKVVPDAVGPTPREFQLAFRRRTDVEGERTLIPAILYPTALFVDSIHALDGATVERVAILAGLWASLPVDYLVRATGKGDIRHDVIALLPDVEPADPARGLALRSLRLNCLTSEYAPLWSELYEPSWRSDRWALPHSTVELGAVDPLWTASTALRRDVDRRQALVEIDALAALALEVSAEQLCVMYRTQFPVLRKYEHSMAFDAEGRKISKHHQSAGYRQLQLQERAKAGELPQDWKSLWSLYEQWEDDPDSVEWLGHYAPPFYRPDREHEMTTAYNEFQRRVDAGEYR